MGTNDKQQRPPISVETRLRKFQATYVGCLLTCSLFT